MAHVESPFPALRPRQDHDHHRIVQAAAAAIAIALVAALAIGVGASRLGNGELGTPPPVVVTTDPGTAMEQWLVANRAEFFPGFAGAYAGECAAIAPDTHGVICSALQEQLGTLEIHTIGVYATDWGADILLERGIGREWKVMAASKWGPLETPSYGSPWSPHSAIRHWLTENPPLADASQWVYVDRCADAGTVAGGQLVLCGTLEEMAGAVRIYGVATAEEKTPRLHVRVVEKSGHEWAVTDVAPGAERIPAAW